MKDVLRMLYTCAFMLLYACLQRHVRVCVAAWSQLQVTFSASSPPLLVFWGRISCWTRSSLIPWGQPVSSRNRPFSSSPAGITGTYQEAQLFTKVLGIRTQVPWLVQHTVYQPSHSPCPEADLVWLSPTEIGQWLYHLPVWISDSSLFIQFPP